MSIYGRYFGRPPVQRSTWNTGIIVTRAWPAEFSEKDYLRMLGCVGEPDTYTVDGVPAYYLSEGRLRVAQLTMDRECLDSSEVHNIACNGGRSNALNYIGNVVDQGVKYFAVGTGVLPTTGPAATDTTLVSEFFRKAPTTVTLTGNQILIATSFTGGEGNTTYSEAGLFGGSTASGTANTGTMFAHSAYSYTKTSLITLTNDYFIFLT